MSDGGLLEPLALTGVTLHVLPAGYSFDLKTREPGIPKVTASMSRPEDMLNRANTKPILRISGAPYQKLHLLVGRGSVPFRTVQCV